MINKTYFMNSIYAKDFTLKDVANKIGVSVPCISYWKNGKREPNINNLKKLCEMLDMDANILLNIEK